MRETWKDFCLLGTQGTVVNNNTKVSIFQHLEQLHPGHSILLPVYRPFSAFVHFMWQCRSPSMRQQCCDSSSFSSSILPSWIYALNKNIVSICFPTPGKPRHTRRHIIAERSKKHSRQLWDAPWLQERFEISRILVYRLAARIKWDTFSDLNTVGKIISFRDLLPSNVAIKG